MMEPFLQRMAAASRARAERLVGNPGRRAIDERAAQRPPPIPLELSSDGFDLIAEAKLAGPNTGRLVASNGSEAVIDLATSYARSGACAISVLTVPDEFEGAEEHLEAAASAVDVPVMRKDFLVDPIQVVEARALGASGVLLIARLFDREGLREMTELVADLGMFTLVELFDEADVDTARGVFDLDVLIGVNSRDLESLEVDTERFARLIGVLPGHLPLVAESGVDSVETVRELAALGYRLALVGGHLSTSEDPGATVRDMISAGRNDSSVAS